MSAKDEAFDSSLKLIINALYPFLPSLTDKQLTTHIVTLYRLCLVNPIQIHSFPQLYRQVSRYLYSFNPDITEENLKSISHTLIQAHQSLQSSQNEINEKWISTANDWNSSAAIDFSQIAIGSGSFETVRDPSENDNKDSSISTTVETSTSKSSAAGPSSQLPSAWLRLRCGQLAIIKSGDGISAAEMAASVLSMLTDDRLSDENIQGDLFDAFAGDFDAVADVLSHRSAIRANADAILSDCAHAQELEARGVAFPTSSEIDTARRGRGRGRGRKHVQTLQQPVATQSQITIRDIRQENLQKEQMKEARRLVRAGLLPDSVLEEEDDDELPIQQLGGSLYEERLKAFPGIQGNGDGAIGAVDRVGLPKGATRTVGKGYEEVLVPPPSRNKKDDIELVQVSIGLKEHPELLQAMKGVKTLNRLQSSVFPMAFHSDENLLVCAPTGAGKTNVALLTIFREIIAVKTRTQRAFKVVYVAPMKALAAEVTEKFSSRLAPLGLLVREFTGDMSLTRYEAMKTHILVTTPEKWDVVTRKTGSELGDAVTLFIIDEIHLLHDERGAVLESIVARTLRLSETAQKQIRLVGLSATLPNYADVGSFMKVNPEKGLFHFDGTYRPVPLSQTFIGISEGGTSNSNEARRRRENKLHEMAWKKVKDSLQRGHQAMIFVHSRKGTGKAAREMLSRAAQDNVEDIFLGGQTKQSSSGSWRGGSSKGDKQSGPAVLPTWAVQEISKSRTADIRELCTRGVGIHNAGLPRPDRKLVEKLFAEGAIRLLCCTATLAWGVNLPARSVIIMGTEVYDAQKGGFVQLGMLDVMQIFGRAGRPQFDTEGEGTIITMHEHLGKYLSLLTSSIPIESTLGASASKLADHLNAEIVSGTVSSIGEGVRWLGYTYLSVRMPLNPLVYGIEWTEVDDDPGLHERRAILIKEAGKALDDARMCRYDPRTGTLSPTDLGRASSHFYVSHETIVLWNELLGNTDTEYPVTEKDWEELYSLAIHAISCATEFEQMRSRQEEMEELDGLTRHACPIPLKSGAETREGKVSILLQAHISKAPIRMSDLSYVIQSSTRLLRALFEISLRKGLPGLSVAALELARASESRIWPFQHPLWQFTFAARRERGNLITPETIAAIEGGSENNNISTLRRMTKEDLSVLIRAPKMVTSVQRVLRSIPTLDIEKARIAPISTSLLRIDLSLYPSFRWNDSLHGSAESWWLWIEDKEENRIYFSQKIVLAKRQVQSLQTETEERTGSKGYLEYSFTVAVFDPPSSHYYARIESDRWHTQGGATAELRLANISLPDDVYTSNNLMDLRPLSVKTILSKKEASIFSDSVQQLTPLQTQAFHLARHTDENILLAAPSGSGKQVIVDVCILRALNEQPRSTILIIVPDEASIEMQKNRWSKSQSIFEGRIETMSNGNIRGREVHLQGVSMLIVTPMDLALYASSWTDEVLLSQFSLVILNRMNILSQLNYVPVEEIISRLHRLSKLDKNRHPPRVVGVSEMIPNAAEVARWLSVNPQLGLLCFDTSTRQVQRESHVIGVAGDRYGSRMQSMNRLLYSMIQRYSAKKPVLVFVSSRRQILLTAQDVLRLAALDGKPDAFKCKRASDQSSKDIQDLALQRSLSKGIGLYHNNLSHRERQIVENLFQKGQILLLISTFDMAASLRTSCHQVVVKGMEVYNASKHRYEDIPVSDILHFIGMAGRPGVDSTCYASIFVHEPKQTLVKKILYEPLAVESALIEDKVQVLLREIVSGVISYPEQAIDWLSSTFVFQRLLSNPGYYGIKKKSGMKKSGKKVQTLSGPQSAHEQRLNFCCELVEEVLTYLNKLDCVKLTKNKTNNLIEVVPTYLGQIAVAHNLKASAVSLLKNRIHECESMENILAVVCRTEVNSEVDKGFDDDALWKELLERVCSTVVASKRYQNVETAAVGLGINGWIDSPEKRCKLLCYSVVVDEVCKTRDMGIDRVNVYQWLEKRIVAGFEIAVETGQLRVAKEFVRLGQCLYQGALPDDDFWRLVDLEGTKLSIKSREAGYSKLEDIKDDEQSFMIFLTKHSDNNALKLDVQRRLNRIPKVMIDGVVVENEDGTKALIVSLSIKRKSGSGLEADCKSRITKRREGGYIIIVSDEKEGNIISTRRVASPLPTGLRNSSDKQTIDYEFEIEAKLEGSMCIWVASDVFIGVEAECRAHLKSK